MNISLYLSCQKSFGTCVNFVNHFRTGRSGANTFSLQSFALERSWESAPGVRQYWPLQRNPRPFTRTPKKCHTQYELDTVRVAPRAYLTQTSATIAGLIIGPLIFVPAARLVGMCSVCFWTMVANTAFSAWAGAASGPNDFISYAVARGLGGLMCAIPQVLTGG